VRTWRPRGCKPKTSSTSAAIIEKRTVEKFVALPYDIPKGNVSAYFPEANPLIPIASVAKISNTPTSKYVVVTVAAPEAVTQTISTEQATAEV
jgi:hypothetical protein